MLGSRGMVVLGAVVLAGLAFFVLMRGGDGDNAGYAPRGVEAAKPPEPVSRDLPSRTEPALDDIDAKSRAKMRELLRRTGDE